MDLYQEIWDYRPFNEQEEQDKAVMLRYMSSGENALVRENQIAHFTTSVWTVNKERTKTLMAYHNIYDSWAWIGGHADGEGDLPSVAMRELREETGVCHAALVRREIFSLEILPVEGHMKNGRYVPSHLHLNITYLAEADEGEALAVNPAENQAVRWWTFEDAMRVSKEPWFVERIYSKLEKKCKLAEWSAKTGESGGL